MEIKNFPNQNSTIALSSLIICDYLSLFQFSSMETCCIAHSVGQLPPGFEIKFNPKPKILVCDYLVPKICGQQLPCTSAVKECDLYGSKKPDQIWEELGGLALGKGEGVFFFTTLTKTNRNFKRKNDLGGTWIGKGGDKVFSGNVNEVNKPIGRCRRLVYAPPTKEVEPPQEKSELEHCGWTVFEYTVDVKDSELQKDLFKYSTYSTQVLCQLRKQEQNHQTNTTGKRKRDDSANQDSHTDAGDPSDSIFNRLPLKIENCEVQNFNTGGGVPPGLNYTQPSDPSLEHDKESDFLRGLTQPVSISEHNGGTYPTQNPILDQLQVQDSQIHNLDQLQVHHSPTDVVVPPSQLVSISEHNRGTNPDYNQLPQIFDMNWEDILRLQNSNTGHVVPRSPLNPTELPPTLEIDAEWTLEGILHLLDLTPNQPQGQDSQSHNLDQVQVQDSITDDVVPPSQLVSNSQHNWGTYLVPQSPSDIPDIPDTGATSSELEESWKDYFRWEDYSRSRPSRIPDPMETEI